MSVEPVEAAERVTLPASDRHHLDEYYGFHPEREYVIRSRSHRYQSLTHARRFVNGECIAPRMRTDAGEDLKWNRGERLRWFEQNAGYRVYERGNEPPADIEPMWLGQETDETEIAVDHGEEEKWEAVPEAERFPSVKDIPEHFNDRATSFVAAGDPDDMGEEPEPSRPESRVTPIGNRIAALDGDDKDGA